MWTKNLPTEEGWYFILNEPFQPADKSAWDLAIPVLVGEYDRDQLEALDREHHAYYKLENLKGWWWFKVNLSPKKVKPRSKKRRRN